MIDMRTVKFNEGVVITISDVNDGNMKDPSLPNWADGKIERNREEFLQKSGIPIENVVLIKADYSDDNFCRYNYIINTDKRRLGSPVADIRPSDGLVTKTPNIGIFLPLADCLGVVFYDEKHRILMVVHSGRHNLEQEGLKKAVEFLGNYGSKAADLKVWLSPSAGVRNYPLHACEGKSLEQVAWEQLTSTGVTDIMVDDIDVTTDENYYSHSQGDHDKRFAILAYML